MGFSLDEIKAILGAPPLGLRETLAQHRAMLRERRRQLDAIIKAVERAEDVVAEGDDDWDTIVSVIRAIQMDQNNNWAKQYFTEEQLQKMQELSEQSYSEGAKAKMAARPAWTQEDQKRVDEQYNA